MVLALAFGACKKDKDDDTTPTTTPTAYSIESTDYGDVGDLFIMRTYTTVTGDTFTVGSAGQDLTWSFGTIPTSTETDTIQLLDPTSHWAGTGFTTANLLMDNKDGTFTLINKTTDKFELVGMVMIYSQDTIRLTLSDAWKLYSLPMKYSTTNVDDGTGTYEGTIDYNGTDLPARIKVASSVNSLIDGEGNISTPTGTYKCLREKRIEITGLTVSLDMTGMGTYIEVVNQVDTTYQFNFMTKDKKWTLLEIETDSAWTNISSISYLLD